MVMSINTLQKTIPAVLIAVLYCLPAQAKKSDFLIVKDRAVAELIKTSVADEQTKAIMDKTNKDGSFNDINSVDLSRTARFPQRRHTYNLVNLARAHKDKASSYHQSRTLKEKITVIEPCAAEPSDAEPNIPVVIFDTDIGSDCDDAGALAVLHALADAQEIRILGVIFSSGKNRYGVGTCDAINTYYGRGDLALGQYQLADVGDDQDSYTKRIATDTRRFGHDVVDDAPDLVSVYCKLLESQPDQRVTIVTVGHPHGLVHLLRDPRGARLVRAKVDRWVAMGSCGWNFRAVGMSAYSQELLEKWPMPFYISPVGKNVITGNRLLPKTPETNPVREAYRLWGNNALANGRSSWDQVALLSVARPKLFNLQHSGRVERKPDGQVIWNPAIDNPEHHLVSPKLSHQEMAYIIEELMARAPKAHSSP